MAEDRSGGEGGGRVPERSLEILEGMLYDGEKIRSVLRGAFEQGDSPVAAVTRARLALVCDVLMKFATQAWDCGFMALCDTLIDLPPKDPSAFPPDAGPKLCAERYHRVYQAMREIDLGPIAKLP